MALTNNVPDADFVAAIADLAHETSTYDAFRQKLIIADGVVHAYDDPKTPLPEKLAVSTLDAVAAYIANQIAGIPVAIVIPSPTVVRVVAPVVGEIRQQLVFLESNAFLPTTLKLNEYMDMEKFMIMIGSAFLPSDGLANVRQIAATVRAGKSAEIKDDGVTQIVVSQAGLTNTERKKLEPAQMLIAHRTFAEVEQPEAEFLLRMDQVELPGGKGLSAVAGLWEADGGLWRVTAMRSIAAYLESACPAGTVILA